MNYFTVHAIKKNIVLIETHAKQKSKSILKYQFQFQGILIYILLCKFYNFLKNYEKPNIDFLKV